MNNSNETYCKARQTTISTANIYTYFKGDKNDNYSSVKNENFKPSTKSYGKIHQIQKQ